MKPRTANWVSTKSSPLSTTISPFLELLPFPPTPNDLPSLTAFASTHPLYSYCGATKPSFAVLYSNSPDLYAGAKVYADRYTTHVGASDRTLVVFQPKPTPSARSAVLQRCRDEITLIDMDEGMELISKETEGTFV